MASVRHLVAVSLGLAVAGCVQGVEFGNVSPEVNVTAAPPPASLLASEQARAAALRQPLFPGNATFADVERVYQGWFQLVGYNRVLMASADGAVGGGTSSTGIARAVEIAKTDCDANRTRRNLQAPCVVIAVDNTVSRDLNRPVDPATAAEREGAVWGVGPFVLTRTQAFAPQVVAGNPSYASNAAILWGPERAKGVIIWSHGFAGMNREQRFGAPFPVVMALNREGWDILRFDRDPALDLWDSTVTHYHRRLPLLKQAGYKKIVLAGQSLGGSLALSLLSWPNGGMIDGVISVAGSIPVLAGRRLDPLNMGASGTQADSQGRLDNWRTFVNGLNTRARVVQIGFAGDELAQFARESHQHAREVFPTKGIPYLSIVPADTNRFNGHGAGSGWALAADYATCIRVFLEDGRRDASCRADAVMPGR